MSGRPRVGVFGGTFDPVHLGHLVSAADLQAALGLDAVLFVPAGTPPHKSGIAISEDRHRLAMLHLATAGNPAFRVDATDIERGGLSYTVDLLALLANCLAPADLWFLMGEDSLRDLPTWRSPERIAQMARLGVARRPGIDADLDRVEAALPGTRGRIDLVDTPLIGISATDLRARVAAGRTISYQVPAAVERYILDHGLYRRPGTD
ncbi:MAG: nicotinate-nucleotide adenylyltransferase [Chloroflexota bacterium]